MVLAKGTDKIILLLSSLVVIFCACMVIFWFVFDIYWQFVITAIILVCYIFVIWSFRNPAREIIRNTKNILSPADGKFTELKKTEDGLYCVILMSPFDVHMNRSPIDGVVIRTEFKKGSHWPVYFSNYAKKNQRNTIEIYNETENIRAIITQVSGMFARRTLAYVKEGDSVNQGDIIGTIIFGSITSLEIISTKKFKTIQQPSMSAKAGLTIIAKQG
jgi:phosphatidylserine decarboxylase